MILNAKCHAIRDAQILEKNQIRGEMETEERRLDLMMSADRVNAIKIEEEIERKRKEERLLGAMKVMEQIQENEQVHAWAHNAAFYHSFHCSTHFKLNMLNWKC